MSETLIAPETAAAPERAPVAAETPRRAAHVLRFDRVDRTLHGFLMLSFLGLAFSGMPVLFSTTPWAGRVARLLGGYTVIHRMHRVFATIMIVVFIVHVGRLLRRVVARKDYSVFWGPASMVPQPRDLADMVQHIRWFVGLGPRPAFDRYTYWEKFDYWAVLWGTALMGAAGLVLWFPMAASRVLPGWLFNVALFVHGAEATLAIVFIFAIHFFNGHLRPGKFPMDMVIFTGSVSREELRHERAGQYQRLAASGTLDRLEVSPPTTKEIAQGHLIGAIGLSLGIALFILILYATLR